ncbi:amidohydrolase [Curvibacter sp. CHRR-16]|uniref:amidohydrolase n=1 Tax=Curvibacter sp. CHRR-16 TaxID=2835872 RepID=UPI001BD93B97|nr:amidohydrolase [Curvibacter sp. CHRR-16]MBT0571071.1 amidohydrolase [Curvibacter sp. CHRR-16]
MKLQACLPLRRMMLLACAGLLLVGCKGSNPDVIFYGGPVLTVDAQDHVAQALAIRDGVITAVGSSEDVMATRGAGTLLVDLKGRTLMPGFVAAHEHPSITAVFSGAVDLSGFRYRSNAQVWQALRQAIAEQPKGAWIYAGGLDAILTPDLKIPSRQELDAMAPDNPLVLVSQTLHSFWANSRAFAEAGIGRDSPDPGAGSYYERDAQGDLTGFVAETRAAAPLLKGLKSPWKVYNRYVDVLDGLLARGVTSVASLGYNVPPMLAKVAASRQLRPRIRQFFYLVEDELQYLPDIPDTQDPYFRVLGLKLWHDGSPYTGSMYTSKPYLDSPLGRTLGIRAGSHGQAMIEEAALVEKIQRYTAAGWQVAIHSQGDASNAAVLHAIELAGPLAGATPSVRLEHGVFLPAERMQQLAQLQVTPSFHIHHIKFYGDALAQSIVGLQAAWQTLPVRSAFDYGVHPTLHADSPMFAPDGFALMQTAMNRRTGLGLLLNPQQGITVQQAVRAMTINGAWQLRLAAQTGSLEVGKWADLQIVDRNPYESSVETLDTIRTQEVYVGGRLQYQAIHMVQ